MLRLYTDLAERYGIKFFNADNMVVGRYGCSAECCGTDFLRNHKVWGGARRALAFPDGLDCSQEFGKCLVNFTRSDTNNNRTISQVCREYNEKENARMRKAWSHKANRETDLSERFRKKQS